MFITLFTDASFNRRLRRGTWAAWAKATPDLPTMRRSSIIRAQLEQSGDAELSAIANGLQAVKQAFGSLAGHRILAQTDSQEAIDAIRLSSHPRRYSHEVVKHILFFILKEKVSVSFRHVKGHRGTASRRSAVNTWCDEEAKRQMALLFAEAALPSTFTESETNALLGTAGPSEPIVLCDILS